MKRPNAEKNGNEYYAKISRKIRNIKYISLLMMVVCAFLTLWAYKENLTYGNLRYLLRDMDEAGSIKTETDTVYYAADEKNVFAYYRDDLAVASSNGVTFHRAFGSRSFSDNVNFNSPVLAVSEKYLLAADIGGHNLYVYNSLGRVYDEKFDTEIVSIAACDNGNFAVCVKNKKGGCDISVYDRNFKKSALITRASESYLIGFLDSGELYICESTVKNASLYTEISFYAIGESDTQGSVSESGIVLDVQSVKGGFGVLTTRSVNFYIDRTKSEFYSFGTSNVLFADFAKDGVALLTRENSSGEGYVAYRYCTDGTNERYSIAKGAKGIAICGKKTAVLYEGYVSVCENGSVTDMEIPFGARDILSVDNSSVIVCYNDYAKIFSVK